MNFFLLIATINFQIYFLFKLFNPREYSITQKRERYIVLWCFNCHSMSCHLEIFILRVYKQETRFFTKSVIFRGWKNIRKVWITKNNRNDINYLFYIICLMWSAKCMCNTAKFSTRFYTLVLARKETNQSCVLLIGIWKY